MYHIRCCGHALVHAIAFVCVLQSEYMMHKGKAALNISQTAQWTDVDCWKETNNGEENGSAPCFEKESPF